VNKLDEIYTGARTNAFDKREYNAYKTSSNRA
jgi:hypothetical protein